MEINYNLIFGTYLILAKLRNINEKLVLFVYYFFQKYSEFHYIKLCLKY